MNERSKSNIGTIKMSETNEEKMVEEKKSRKKRNEKKGGVGGGGGGGGERPFQGYKPMKTISNTTIFTRKQPGMDF